MLALSFYKLNSTLEVECALSFVIAFVFLNVCTWTITRSVIWFLSALLYSWLLSTWAPCAKRAYTRRSLLLLLCCSMARSYCALVGTKHNVVSNKDEEDDCVALWHVVAKNDATWSIWVSSINIHCVHNWASLLTKLSGSAFFKIMSARNTVSYSTKLWNKFAIRSLPVIVMQLPLLVLIVLTFFEALLLSSLELSLVSSRYAFTACVASVSSVVLLIKLPLCT